jgi:hypothetical protein
MSQEQLSLATELECIKAKYGLTMRELKSEQKRHAETKAEEQRVRVRTVLAIGMLKRYHEQQAVQKSDIAASLLLHQAMIENMRGLKSQLHKRDDYIKTLKKEGLAATRRDDNILLVPEKVCVFLHNYYRHQSRPILRIMHRLLIYLKYLPVLRRTTSFFKRRCSILERYRLLSLPNPPPISSPQETW